VRLPIADIPGDPLNVALLGTEAEVKKTILDAGWYPADSLTLKSCLEMVEAAVLKRQYDDAPVSNLFLFGRKQDLAFEQPVGDNPPETSPRPLLEMGEAQSGRGPRLVRVGHV
jgi:hypothetical protein